MSHPSMSFGTILVDGMVLDDGLLTLGNIDNTTKREEKLQDDKAAITNAKQKVDDGEVVPHQESDGYEDESIEDEIDSWLNFIRSDLKSLTQTIRSTAGGVAHFVHKSAITVVNEIKSLDIDDKDDDNIMGTADNEDSNEVEVDDDVAVNNIGKDAEATDERNDVDIKCDMYPFDGALASPTKLLLPWELENSSISEEKRHTTSSLSLINDKNLKQRILMISHDEENFTLTKQSHHIDVKMSFDTFDSVVAKNLDSICNLIQELFQNDTQLLHLHTQHQFQNGNMESKTMMNDEEKNFWYNYFYACTMIRIQYMSENGSVTASICNDNDTAVPLTSDLDHTSCKTHVHDDNEEEDDDDDDDDDDNSYVCLSDSDGFHNKVIRKAPSSLGMKSVDSMVFVEDISMSSTSSTTGGTTTGTLTNTNNVSTSFFSLFT